MPSSHAKAAGRLRRAAVAVLVVGWLLAAVVFALAPAVGEKGAAGDRIVGGQVVESGVATARELQQLERLGGTAAVLTFKFDRWFKSLWSGRPLACTLAVSSLLVALGCLHVAGLMLEETHASS